MGKTSVRTNLCLCSLYGPVPSPVFISGKISGLLSKSCTQRSHAENQKKDERCGILISLNFPETPRAKTNNLLLPKPLLMKIQTLRRATAYLGARYFYTFNKRLEFKEYRTQAGSTGWLYASIKAIKQLQKNTDKIKTPILLFQAGHRSFS